MTLRLPTRITQRPDRPKNPNMRGRNPGSIVADEQGAKTVPGIVPNDHPKSVKQYPTGWRLDRVVEPQARHAAVDLVSTDALNDLSEVRAALPKDAAVFRRFFEHTG
jgi:hypothetical protein